MEKIPSPIQVPEKKKEKRDSPLKKNLNAVQVSCPEILVGWGPGGSRQANGKK